MRHYLIIVEGAHDIALIEKILRVNGVKEKISSKDKLPDIWKKIIPGEYPFDGDKLDRITPIPSFLKNEELSVAIKNAGSDSEILRVLYQTIKLMDIKDALQLSGIFLLCDADAKTAEEKREGMLNENIESQECQLEKDSMQVIVYGKHKVPLFSFIFPDNEKKGNLENLLLDAASVVYPELWELAECYVQKAAELPMCNLKREQDRNKAKVGCITNAMKPGKANQVSIADNDCVSKVTLEKCEALRKLSAKLTEMIQR